VVNQVTPTLQAQLSIMQQFGTSAFHMVVR